MLSDSVLFKGSKVKNQAIVPYNSKVYKGISLESYLCAIVYAHLSWSQVKEGALINYLGNFTYDIPQNLGVINSDIRNNG